MQAKTFLSVFVATVMAAGAVAFAAPAPEQPLLTDKHEISGYAARKMIEACLAQAAREGYPIALAVTDSAGNLISYQATDGATDNTGLTAQLKARTAAVFRRPTDELYERVNMQINRAPEWMGYFPVPGGYPVVVDGETVGAIGAGAAGLSGGRDEDCAQSAIRSVFGDGDAPRPASAEPLLVTRKVLTPAAARRLIDACVGYAEERDISALGITVVDPDATLLAFQATQGAQKTALDTAELKAKTAARWQRPTIELWERVNKQINRAPEWAGDFAQPGGFPIFVGKDMVGAIGAGGGIGNQDDACAQAAVTRVFGSTASMTRPN